MSDTFTLPYDTTVIERILPHRYPFLLVDRITEFEPDVRIVGVKMVTSQDPFLLHMPGERPTLPFTIITEAFAQVGAVLILAKPENREKLIYFMGIDRIRFRSEAHPGDVIVMEARVERLRSRMGALRGTARVGDRLIAEGRMSFALNHKS